MTTESSHLHSHKHPTIKLILFEMDQRTFDQSFSIVAKVVSVDGQTFPSVSPTLLIERDPHARLGDPVHFQSVYKRHNHQQRVLVCIEIVTVDHL